MSAQLIHMLPSRIAQIGQLVYERRIELGLTQSQFAMLVSKRLGRTMEPTRISKIERSGDHAARDGQTAYAKGLKQDEVVALSALIQVPEEFLDGVSERGGVIFDPMAEPNRAQEIVNLLRFADQDSQELLGWAAFLPCSLETPAFMEAHHAGLFQELSSDPKFFQAVTQHYNYLGANRRHRLLNFVSRPWHFYHLILQSDLYRIAHGEGEEYSAIRHELRKECLRELIRLVADDHMKISLIVSDADRPPGWSTGLDSLVVFDQKLAFWRQGNGTFFWTTNPKAIQIRREWLSDFKRTARYQERADVLAMLDSMCQKVI